MNLGYRKFIIFPLLRCKIRVRVCTGSGRKTWRFL